MHHEYVLFLDSDAFVCRHSDWLEQLMVWLCNLKPVLTQSACFLRQKLQSDKLPSSFAFNDKLRP
jgi:hypothetical protein